MDRIKFFQSVNTGNRKYDSVITTLFDQFSALYNIAGEFDVNEVYQNGYNVDFDISTRNSEDIDKLCHRIADNHVITIYEKTFSVTTTTLGDRHLKISFTPIK